VVVAGVALPAAAKYRGLVPDAVLDDSGFQLPGRGCGLLPLTDERYRRNRSAVAIRDGE
jgi:hypothetical protein